MKLPYAFVSALLFLSSVGRAKAEPAKIEFFEKKVRPALVKHCYECHSAKSEKVKGGLLLDSKLGIRNGGDVGPAVVPGDLKKSLLVEAIGEVTLLARCPNYNLCQKRANFLADIYKFDHYTIRGRDWDPRRCTPEEAEHARPPYTDDGTE